MNRSRNLVLMPVVLTVAMMACNLPSQQPDQSLPPQASSSPQAPISVPAVSPDLPGSPALPDEILYDVDSQSNASKHRAPYGDVYYLNRFERPFTQNDMTYLPNIDIVRFRMTRDNSWFYVYIELIGSNPNDPLNIFYGVEIDKDRDGTGDLLVWAHPPFTSQWTVDGTAVLSDSNHDTGGVKADASDTPFSGNGFDTVLFNQGQGSDPGLAWARIDPQNPNIVELAFKQSLPGTSFMWGVWADAGLRDPSRFNYNDRFTLQQAGSPLTDSGFYPIKAIFAVDNTCHAAYGFKPTGYEINLCSFEPPKATKQPKEPTPSIPGIMVP